MTKRIKVDGRLYEAVGDDDLKERLADACDKIGWEADVDDDALFEATYDLDRNGSQVFIEMKRSGDVRIGVYNGYDTILYKGRTKTRPFVAEENVDSVVAILSQAEKCVKTLAKDVRYVLRNDATILTMFDQRRLDSLVDEMAEYKDDFDYLMKDVISGA